MTVRSDIMQKSLTNSRGFAFFIVLVYVQILLLILLHALTFLSVLRPLARNDRERTQVYYAAEAGLYFTAEAMLRDPADHTPRQYIIEDMPVQVLVKPWKEHQLWLTATASRSPHVSVQLWMIIDQKTRKITDWSEEKIE